MESATLEQVLLHIHNWFERGSVTATNCRIEDGALPDSVASSILEGQWYRIEGSVLNDGLHRHPAVDLEDETFSGTIALLAIPRALLNVVDEIDDWIQATDKANKKALESPYQSESFDGYSYTLKGGSSGSNAGGGSLGGWQAEFASRLRPWRKLY